MNLSKIKEHCDTQNISIEKLAEKIDVTKATLYRSILEDGGDIKASNLEKICEILKVDPREFFTLSFISRYERLRDEIRVNNGVIAVFQSEKKDFQSEIEQLKQQTKHLQAEIDVLKATLDGQTKTNTQLAESNKQLMDYNTYLKSTVDELKEHNQYLKDLPKLQEAIERNSAKGKKDK